MKTKVADLKKSQKEYRSSTEDLKTRISQMMANSDEDKKTIKKLHKDLMISSLKHGNENAEAADIKALEDRLTEQQKQNLEKNNEIQFLRLKVQKLQDDIEAKDTMILRLQENVNKWASDVQKEQEKNSGNQDLSSENQTLRDEVEFLKNERELMQKDLDEEKAARRELEEPVKEDKSRFSKEYKKLEMKVTALPPLPPRCRRRTSKSAQHLLYDMETLKMENANLTAKLDAMENQYSGAKFKHEALSEQRRDKLLQVVDELKGRQSERDTVQKEQEKNSALQRSYDSIVSQEHAKTQKLNRLTSENQDLSSENQTLRDEVEFLKNERELMQNDLDEEKAARRELEEAVKKEKSRFSKEYKKLQMKVESTSKSAEHLLYDMETLKMENANLIAKLKAMENQYSGAKFKHEALSEQRRDKLLQRVDELKGLKSGRYTLRLPLLCRKNLKSL
ncbi:uncharacterized protein LOC113033167 [Astatotilapia calliptera]|uniref:uncharacterized protein LOC113033167 n=1 Tax=Astatotilapia calliptera TaxID=8154 RepID=UPI000E40C9D4|nr:uncharacterized protein LOC113033167 [Astatotilapia calliptera]